MSFPPPTEKQARLIWAAVTGISAAVLVALVVALVWGLGRVLDVLAPVVFPLAVAGALAYLLEPVVSFLERRRIPRVRAVALVFACGALLIAGLGISVGPRLVVETRLLAANVPAFVDRLGTRVLDWVNRPPAPLQAALARLGVQWTPPVAQATNALSAGQEAVATVPGPGLTLLDRLDPQTVERIATQAVAALRGVGGWLLHQLTRVTGLFGVVAGVALIPVFLFYLLVQKPVIAERWTAYLPVRDSRLKEELVFVLRSINEALIAFFRGQVLVAMCDGVLYAIGFALIGLPYALLIGAAAMVLTIVPFLGAFVTCATALLIALVTYGDWQHPLLVGLVFVLVQAIEGYVLQPKILGQRVGLHPMVILVAILTGTTLLGGILGALLAIPAAAALRVILFRYVWRKPSG